MTRRALVCLLLRLLAAGLFGGCWSRKEIHELAFVMAIGVDWDEERGRYDLTLQVVRPALVPQPTGQGSGGGLPQERPYFFIQVGGGNLAEALGEALKFETRRLYLGHLQAVGVREAAARRGIGPALDYLWRHQEVRPTAEMLVAASRARTLLQA